MMPKRTMKQRFLNPKIAGLLFGLFAILLPYGSQVSNYLGAPAIYLRGLIIEYIEAPYYTGTRIVFFEEFIAAVPYSILRFIFAYLVFLYYEGKVTRVFALLIGLLSELPLLIMYVPQYTQFLLGSSLYTFVVPVPILFIIGLLYLYLMPNPEIESL